MFQQSSLDFLKKLEKNNNKPWFDQHRDRYETTKADFQEMITSIIRGIATFDPPIGNLEAKNCTFRINRDIRFSKNKTPYKNNLAGYFNKDGKKGIGSGYYIHIQPGESFAAGGIWMPEPVVLTKIRQEIDYNFGELQRLLQTKSFRKYFPRGLESEGSLLRPPKGYEANNPAVDYLKMKNFIVSRAFTDAEILSSDFVKNVTHTFKAMKPMIDFFNRAID